MSFLSLLKRLSHAARLAVFACLLVGLFAQPLPVSARPAQDFDPGAVGAVYALALQPDGMTLVGGSFTQIDGQPRSRIARLNSDGSLDDTFDPNADGSVYAIAVQADGKIVIGGSFSTVGGAPHSHLARLNSDGTVDGSFTAEADGAVYAIAVQNDGKIVLGGSFYTAAGSARSRIARLNASGSLDTTFNPGASSYVMALALQPDGKIVVGGWFTLLGGDAHNRLGRLNADGSLDTSFNPSFDRAVNSLALMPAGSIVAGGNFTSVNSSPRGGIAKLDANGGLVTSFAPDTDGLINTVAVQPDGKILVGGFFTMLAGNSAENLGRLNPDGSPDSGFSAAADNTVSAFTVQPDGRIVVGGSFTTLNGILRPNLGRLLPDGSTDRAFSGSVDGDVYALAALPGSKLLVGGHFTQLSGENHPNIGMLAANGSPDPAFGADLDGDVLALAVQTDGKFLVGGAFNTVNSASQPFLARLNPDGSRDDTFAPVLSGAVNALLVQPDGFILVAGSGPYLVRLSPTGAPDATFSAPAFDAAMNTLALVPGGILVGGIFTIVNGNLQPSLVRLTSSGALDNTFNALASGGSVNALVVTSDGKILAGGSFLKIGGSAAQNVARLYADGSRDTSFTATTDGAINSLALQANGSVLLGGAFNQINGSDQAFVGRVFASGVLDADFMPGLDNQVFALALRSDGVLALGGQFTSLNDDAHPGLALLDNGSISTSLTVLADGSSVTWLRGGTAPELNSTSFDYSTDGGVTYLPLGAGTRITGGWRLSGLSLPLHQSMTVRAQGMYASGQHNGSQSLDANSTYVYLFAPDLTAVKSNDAGGTVDAGATFTWKIDITNQGQGQAIFKNGQTLLRDALPSSALYGTPVVNAGSGVTNAAKLVCAVNANVLTCKASGASVTLDPSAVLSVSFSATPGQSGALVNPTGGVCRVNSNNVVSEDDETNNDCADSLTVSALNPTVTSTVHDGAHTPVVSVPYGTNVHDSAAVSGAFGVPTGTVDFTLFTASSTCTGNSRSAGSVALIAGVADPSDLQDGLPAGNYSFLAHYSGDGVYNPADSTCEPLTVTQADQVITITTSAPASATFGDTFTVDATASSGLDVVYTSLTPTVCTNVGAAFTMISGTGTCTVQYSQPGDSNFNPAPSLTEDVTAVLKSQTIQFDPLANKVFGDAPFDLSAEASSGLDVSLVSNSPTVCTLSGTTVTMLSAGTCSITASQPGDTNFSPAPDVTRSFEVLPAGQTITITTHAPASAVYNTTFTVAATASSGLDVVYSSLTPAVCSNAGAAFTMLTGTGTCTVQYSQPGDDDNLPAPSLTENIAAEKADQSITFGALADKVFGDAPFAVSATASSGLPVSFASTSASCTLSGSTVTITGAGDCTITASQGGDANYNPASPVDQTFTIAKATASLTLGTLNFVYDGTPKPVDVTTTPPALSGVTVLYDGQPTPPTNAGSYAIAATLDNPNYAAPDVTGTEIISKADAALAFGLLNFVYDGSPKPVDVTTSPVVLSGVTIYYDGLTTPPTNAGSYAVAATLDNPNYAAADINGTENIAKADQTITILTPAPLSAPYLGSFTVNASASSGLDVVYTSLTPLVCSNVGGTFTMLVSSGDCIVNYSQPGDDNYNPASAVADETVAATKADQTITFNASDVQYSTQVYPLTASASSGLPVTFAGGAGEPCVISGATFTVTGLGQCNITASQDGDGNFNPAPDVSQTFNVLKGDQTITVTTQAPASATYLSTFNVAANASSGLEVTYSSGDTSVCTNVGGLFTMLTGTGVCPVQYDQPGDSLYNAAPRVTENVNAARSDQTIKFPWFAPPTFGDPDFTLSATATSGLTVSFTASGPCTVTGNVVHITGAGACIITASQMGDGNYNPAPDFPRTVNIAKAAASLALGNLNFVYDGTAKSVTVTTTPADLTGVKVTYDGSILAPSHAGGYAVVATLANPNYTAPQVTGTLVIAKADQTITILTGAPSSAAFGSSFTVAATASSSLPVTYSSGSPAVCTNAGGIFTMLASSGSCVVMYDQPGSIDFNPAPGLSENTTAGKGNVVVGLTADPNPASFGQAITFEATVSAVGPVPTGTVTFKEGSTVLGSGTLDGLGSAAIILNDLPAGDHLIVAEFGGSADYLTGASDPLLVRVDPMADLEISLSADHDPVLADSSVILSAVVKNLGPQTAAAVTVTGSLPVGTSFNAAKSDAVCSDGTGSLVCDLGTLAVGETKTVQVALAIAPHQPDGSVITHVLAVSSTEQDPQDSNNTASLDTHVVTSILVYQYTGDIGPEWTGAKETTAPCGPAFIGEFGNETVNLNLENLVDHPLIIVSFDLYILRSWDGNTIQTGADVGPQPSADGVTIVGPDVWNLKVDGESAVNTTFSNWDAFGFQQAYPDQHPGGANAARTGAAANNNLCYTFHEYEMDSTYHMVVPVTHTGSTLQIDFSALGLQSIDDESWGISNVRVTLVSPDGKVFQYSLFLPSVMK